MWICRAQSQQNTLLNKGERFLRASYKEHHCTVKTRSLLPEFLVKVYIKNKVK